MRESDDAPFVYQVERNVMVPMRDGVRLATDVWRPAGGPPCPAILIRSATNKDKPDFWGSPLMPRFSELVEAGYCVVWQDHRGTGRSDGDWRVSGDDRDDGADTIEWIVQQPWCNGSVGGAGPSHMGMSQWAIANQDLPNYRAFAPAVAPRDYYRDIYYHEGGVESLQAMLTAAVGWSIGNARRAVAKNVITADRYAEIARGIRAARDEPDRLPLDDHPGLAEAAPWWLEFLRHPSRDDFWVASSLSEEPSRVTIPALSIGGWFDSTLNATLEGFQALRTSAGTQAARDGQRLIVGPWNHRWYEGIFPERDFGPTANASAVDFTGEYRRFYDRWLKDDESALEESAPVRIFVMGLDQWRGELDWPLPDTKYTQYYLNSRGAANTAAGDGTLSTVAPPESATDVFVSNPRRPVPTIGGVDSVAPMTGGSGPRDQREVESREDVLCYRTAPLEHPVEVTGPISLTVHISASAPDIDITGKLVDVFPDGRAMLLTEGIIRGRYRDSLAEPEPLETGAVHAITVSLRATSNVFFTGHRIGLELSSSNYPRYARNTNSGGTIAAEGVGEFIASINTVHHGPGNLSALTLPIIDRPG